MADEPSILEEFSDAHNAEMSDEIAELNQKINDLEQENNEFKQRVEELKASVEKLNSENEDFKNQVEKAQSENKAMEARASELGGEVARLHSDLQDSNGELSVLKRELEDVKGKEIEKDVQLEAAEREKALLGAELDAKDKQIHDLKKNVGDLSVVMGHFSETEKNEWETKNEEIYVLQNSLNEKERVIRELNAVINGGKKGSIGGLRQSDWLVVGSTSFAAVAVIGAFCYVRAARKY